MDKMVCPHFTGQGHAMEQNEFNFAGLDIRVVCTQVTGICYLMRKSACLQTKESVFFLLSAAHFRPEANTRESVGVHLLFSGAVTVK
jgi:hypothetical protein